MNICNQENMTGYDKRPYRNNDLHLLFDLEPIITVETDRKIFVDILHKPVRRKEV
jgi:hypothetical protein